MRCALCLYLCGFLLVAVPGCGASIAPKPGAHYKMGHRGSTPPAATSAPAAASYAEDSHATESVFKEEGRAFDISLADARPAAAALPAESAPAPAPSNLALPKPRDIVDPPGDRPRRGAEPPLQTRLTGVLTAGSFDDRVRFDDYSAYLLRNSIDQSFRAQLGERVEIEVCDANGRPVGDARIELQRIDEQQQVVDVPAITMTTASDGRALLLTAWDGEWLRDTFQVSVTPSDGSPAIRELRRASQQPWRFMLPEAQSALPLGLDLAFVIDTTGSMADELEYLKVEFTGIANEVKRLYPNVAQRYALVLYRDHGDEYVTRTFDFTSSVDEFRQILAAQRAHGGGDYPEAMHLALQQAQQLSWRGKDTARVLFLVGDAPPHIADRTAALNSVRELRRQTIRLYPVGASGVAAEAEFVMRAAAFLTGGQYLFLTDHSGVGNRHATPDVPSFSVEHLDRIMLRMIASELAGRRLTSQEIIDQIVSPRVTPIDPRQLQSQVVFPVQPGVLSVTPPANRCENRYDLLDAAIDALKVAAVAVALIFVLLIDRSTVRPTFWSDTNRYCGSRPRSS